jgi:hypothetical protein
MKPTRNVSNLYFLHKLQIKDTGKKHLTFLNRNLGNMKY